MITNGNGVSAMTHTAYKILREEQMNHERFNEVLNAIAHAQTPPTVEAAVAELHKLTDHGLPSDRIKAEEAIMAARRRVGTLPTSMEIYCEGKFEDELLAIGQHDASTLIEKGRAYGDSWKRRGGVGAFMMLARKWDRIENQAKAKGYDVFEACRDTDMMDDIRDLRCYLLLVEHEVTK